MNLFAIAFIMFGLALPLSQAYLWPVSGNSAVYPPVPKALPSVSNLEWGHCNSAGNCIYFERPVSRTPLPPGAYNHRDYFQKKLPPGLGTVGWRYENGRYVKDVYEGYGNVFCRGRYC